MMKNVFVKLSMSLISALVVLAFSPLGCCLPSASEDSDSESESDIETFLEEYNEYNDASFFKMNDKPNVHISYLGDKDMIDGFSDTDVNNKDPKIRILIYESLSFDADRYHRILFLNNVLSSENELNFDWSYTIISNCKRSQLKKIIVKFENKKELKRIIFCFDPNVLLDKPMLCGHRRSVVSVIDTYNDLLKGCGISDKFNIDYETYCDINKVVFDNFIDSDSVIEFRNRTYKNVEELMKDYHLRILRFNSDIGPTCFLGDSSLVNVALQGAISEIGSRAFSSCKFLKNIVLPKFVMKIGECAFENCESLECINIPDDVTEIDDNAFKGCKNLKYIKYKNNVYNDAKSFIQAFHTQVLKLNGNITKRKFSNRKDLENIEIQGLVYRIDDNAFEQCSNLKTVKVPNSVTEIGNDVFLNCFNLRSIEHKGKVYYDAKEFERAVNTRVLKVKKNIVDKQFVGRQDLKCIEIPNHVESIGFNAFRGCLNLTSAIIPSSVKVINLSAFEFCKKLNYIQYEGKIFKSIGEFLKAFEGKITF